MTSYSTFTYYSLKFDRQMTMTLPSTMYDKLLAKFRKQFEDDKCLAPTHLEEHDFICQWLSYHY